MPGPLAPMQRPKRKRTNRLYSGTMRMALNSKMANTSTTPAAPQIKIPDAFDGMITSLKKGYCVRQMPVDIHFYRQSGDGHRMPGNVDL
jgi:hypothetical protein